MIEQPPLEPIQTPAAPAVSRAAVPYGVNEIRLNGGQWLAVGAIVLLVVLLVPWLWPKLERFQTGPDYRIPYELSKDYWLWSQRLNRVSESPAVVVLGDSVVWGEYVLPEGTWWHFLNRATGPTNLFVNAGVNGLFPLALEGLIRWYGGPLRGKKVILHCNVLWLTSPKADLSTEKEEQFNHAGLVPQFVPRIPCYRAETAERLSAVVERNIPFLAWVNHLQNAYFGRKSILKWTLDEGSGSPPDYPNAYRNPLAQVTLRVPSGAAVDSERGPGSRRHKPWSAEGASTTRFEWVGLEHSLQWAAFQRTAALLRERGNDVLVLLGPFNEHMLASEDRPGFHRLRDEIAAWLGKNQFRCVIPELLPSALYADASHPLTAGYEMLAKNLWADESFRQWAGQSPTRQ